MEKKEIISEIIKYRDYIYLIIGLAVLIGILKSCNPDKIDSRLIEINELKLKNQSLKNSIKLIDDSLRIERNKIDSISKIEVKVEKKRNDIIKQGNEGIKIIYALDDSASNKLFAKYLAREDSIYKGQLQGYLIAPRKTP